MRQKMNMHKVKVKMARKMFTRDERKQTNPDGSKKWRPGLFQSSAWQQREKNIQQRVEDKVFENDMRKQRRGMEKRDAAEAVAA